MSQLPHINVQPLPVSYRRRRPSSGPAMLVVALVAMLAFGAGFFAGREYLKYELRSAIQQTFEDLRQR